MILNRLFLLGISTLSVIICRFFPLKKRIVFSSTNNRSFNFNSKPLFEFLIKNKIEGFDISYVINDEALRTALQHEYSGCDNVRFINTTKLSQLFYAATAKVWVSSTLEIPVISLLRDPRRITLHLGHGIPLKNIGLSEKEIPFLNKLNRIILINSFTDVVSYSQGMLPVMKKIFGGRDINYIFLGQPRNDLFNNDYEGLRGKLSSILGKEAILFGRNKFVLYAPTWRAYADTKLFPFDNLDAEYISDSLCKNGIIVFVRSHPFYKAILPERLKMCPNIIELDSQIISDINEYLGAFDFLVTDYSSIFFDFLCTDRKIVFIPYDYKVYESNVGFGIDYYNFTPGEKITSSDELIFTLLDEVDNFRDARKNIREITKTKPSGNCFEVYKYLLNRING
uniref:CDP-glycerol glycerophosphotransferase family protein n=1 Tax=Scandinavium goeteborgense TaxID=1851514 RepID=UPI0013568EEF|nr:CDP-glycerol glycerophosphotransferase family protein [Scandinavium goeteborgense]